MLRHTRVATLALVVATAGCASSKPSLEEKPPPPSPIAMRTETRLGAMAKVRPDSRDAKRILLALDVGEDGHPLDRERPTVAFHFRVMPPRGDTPPELRDAAMLAATLDADPERTFVLAVRPTDAQLTATEVDDRGAEQDIALDKVQVMLARRRDDTPSQDGRMHVAKVFGLDVKEMSATYNPATFQAFVLATRLTKGTAPASFRAPGEGAWTLLRIVKPGEGYLAIDWHAGVGELFPKKGATQDVGAALLRAM